MGQMRPMRLMGSMGLIGLIGLMGLIALMGSCSSDLASPDAEQQQEQQVEPEQSVPMSMEVMSYVTPYETYEVTRTDPAWLPTGYSVDESHKAIGAFFTRETPSRTAEERRIWYNDFGTPSISDDKWFINGKEIPTGDFYLYGFMPYNAATNVSVAPNTVDDVTSYKKGAILDLRGLESVTTKDVCVLVGAKTGTGKDAVSGLKIGQFACTMQQGGEGYENYLFLLFEHIYAKVDFCFRVDEEYAKLRTIKLKGLTLKAYTYEKQDLSDHLDKPKPMAKYGSISVKLKANSTNTSPKDNDVFFTPDKTPGAMDMDPVRIYPVQSADEDVDLELPSSADKYPADYEVVELRGKDKYTEESGFVPYFNFEDPKTKVLYELRSTYDVYDKKGNLIRLNQEATNLIVPYNLFNDPKLEAGRRYKVYLTVKPTFLYVLSDDDLDNPTVVLQ